MKKNVIELGKVYLPRKPNARSTHRRVVAIHGGFVSYSDGGDVNKFCSEKSFRRAVVFTKDEK
jgi:hypothetical protein